MNLEMEGRDAVLPEGLQIQHELYSEAIGTTYAVLDHRQGKETPVQRTLCVLTEKSEAGWSGEFQARAEKLGVKSLPYVARVLDYGRLPEEGWFVLSDPYSRTLASQIPAEGLPSELARTVLLKIVRGLEELHRLGIAHGDVRLEHIFLDSPILDANTGVWVGNAAVGHLPSASEGRLLEPQAVHYLPPEWHGRVQPPSKCADVYALGVLACELFCGRKAVAEARTAESLGQLLETKSSRPAWWGGGLGPSVFDGIYSALAGADARPVDAPALIASVERPKWWEHPWLVPSAAVLLIVLYSAAVRSSYLDANKRVTEQLEASTKKGESLEDDYGRIKREAHETETRLSTRLKGLEESATQLQRQLTDVAGVLISNDSEKVQLQRIQEIVSGSGTHVEDPQSKAREFWTTHPQWVDEAVADEKAAKNPGGLSDEAWKPNSDWLRLVRQLSHDVQKLSAPSKTAPSAPSVTQRALAEFKRAPWDEGQTEAVARAAWREAVDPVGSSEIVQRASKVAGHLHKSGALRKQFKEWIIPLQEEEVGWRHWIRESDSYERFAEWGRAPWNEEAGRLARAELESLKKAADIWTRKAKAATSWNDFDRDTELAANGMTSPADDLGRAEAVNRILSRWKAQYRAKRDWKICVEDGGAAGGYGTYRILYIRVGGKDVAYIDENWISATSRGTATAVSSIAPFEWNVNQPLELDLMAGRSTVWGGGRPRLFYKKFTSPLVFWNLNRDRTLQEKDNSLDLSVPDCPGPPRDWDTSVGQK